MKMEYLRDITAAVLPHRVVLGGPDILPYRTGLKPSYDLYEEFQSKLKLSSSAQADSYRHHKLDTDNSTKTPYHQGLQPIHPEGHVTMEQIFEFGRDRQHLNYIFWSYIRSRPKPHPDDPQAFVFEDALRVIRQHPTFNRLPSPMAAGSENSRHPSRHPFGRRNIRKSRPRGAAYTMVGPFRAHQSYAGFPRGWHRR